MTAAAHIRVERQADILLVTPLATITALTNGGLAADWAGVQNQALGGAIRHIVVDLREIPYFGSSFLEWLVQLWNQVKKNGGRLAICNASTIAAEVIHLARLNTVWTIANSSAEALAALRLADAT